MTHELIGEFFQGSIWYGLGVNSVLKAQEGSDTDRAHVTIVTNWAAELSRLTPIHARGR